MGEQAELQIEVKVGGATNIGGLESKHGRYIQRIDVDQRLDSPDFFSVQLQASEFNEMKALDAVKPGAEIEIALGYGAKEIVAKGEVSYVEPHFSASKLYLTFSGYDFTHRMTRGTTSRTFGDGHATDQDPGSILSTVVSDSGKAGGGSDGLSAATKSAQSKLEYIAQYNMNDYQFVQQVVGSFGMGWDAQSHVDAKKVQLDAAIGDVVLTIYRDKPPGKPSEHAVAVSADFRMSTVRQVAKVEVHGWHMVDKKGFKGVATKDEVKPKIGGAKTGVEQAASKQGGRVLSIVDLPVLDENEAKEVATSILNKLAMDWMTADVVIEGRPKIHAGSKVKMEDFGTWFSGEYLVESCKHVYIAGAPKPYRSYLKLARNSSPPV
ncbi:MAG: hypothetical protein EP329_20460 [Deltaproteobacteria bacterium]|nr:MAG: hypothetical protein EP329_20460 [Deltaproteobacteria bacterium]